MAKADLTAARVRELFEYIPETGALVNRQNRGGGVKAGSQAGSLMSIGYLMVWVNGGNHLVHRIVWLHVHGEWPKGHIDHINGVRSDNRLCNLRDVSRRVNMENQRRPQGSNKSGFLGVSWCSSRGKWVAQIKVNGKAMKLGRFSTPEEAHEKYLSAKRSLHQGCSI